MITETLRPLTGRAVRDPKRLAEEAHRLDLAELRRSGALAGRTVLQSARDSSEVFCTVERAEGRPRALRLLDPRRRAEQRLPLTATPCFLGGCRWWALCDCGRRARVLYRPLGEPRWGCFDCHRLTYRCRQRHRDSLYEGCIGPWKRQERLLADLASRSPRRQLRALAVLDPAGLAELLAAYPPPHGLPDGPGGASEGAA